MAHAMGRVIEERAAPKGRAVSAWETFDSRYSYCHGDHELTVSAREVTDRQARAFDECSPEFALVVEDPLVLLCARFGDAIPWTIAPICWHEIPREARRLPPAVNAPGEARALLHVALVEGPTGRRHAARNFTLWMDFTRALHEAIREQAQTLIDPRAYQRAVNRLRLRCPTPDVLVAMARVRSVGSP